MTHTPSQMLDECREAFEEYADDLGMCLDQRWGTNEDNPYEVNDTRLAFNIWKTAYHHRSASVPSEPKSHRWDRDGERCLDCGDKDWMSAPVCVPREQPPQESVDELKRRVWKAVQHPHDGSLHGIDQKQRGVEQAIDYLAAQKKNGMEDLLNGFLPTGNHYHPPQRRRTMMDDPAKPKYGEPCNGCGWCCKTEVCAIGKKAFGKDQSAPCPALMNDGKRHYCGFVIAEETSALRTNPIIANALGIGKGCCADDPR